MSETGDRVGSKYIVWTDGVLAIVWIKDIGMWKKKTDIEGDQEFLHEMHSGGSKNSDSRRDGGTIRRYERSLVKKGASPFCTKPAVQRMKGEKGGNSRNSGKKTNEREQKKAGKREVKKNNGWKFFNRWRKRTDRGDDTSGVDSTSASAPELNLNQP